MIRVRNCTARPAVRFLVGEVTNLHVGLDGLAYEYREGKSWAFHHTGHEMGKMGQHGGFSPVFVLPEDGLCIDCDIVPGEETLLLSSDVLDRQGWLYTLRAHRITRRDPCGSVWGVLDEFDMLYSIKEASQ